VFDVEVIYSAGNPYGLTNIDKASKHLFVKAHGAKGLAIAEAFTTWASARVDRLAAERSITNPGTFLKIEDVGTLNSPQSASEADSGQFLPAWTHTCGPQKVLANCSSNCCPYQNAKRLIPTINYNAGMGRPDPIYGAGENLRAWLFEGDHSEASVVMASKGEATENSNVGGHNKFQNIDVAKAICSTMDEFPPRIGVGSFGEQFNYVKHYHGQDRRYPLDATRARDEIGWTQQPSLKTGLRKSLRHHVENQDYLRTGAETEAGLSLGR
jgi:dTDP-D-glucose 4,6-dehydratase